MTEPRELTIVQAAQGLRRGELSAEQLTRSCLERIEAREPALRAWVHVDGEGALAAAYQLDREAREQRWQGPLHGIPLAIKDIIDVAGMETRGGTDAFPMRKPEQDADAVERLRKAGAILLGKTVTTPMAYLDPPPTVNPWNAAHTPGGSSSGSAVAVADRQCLAALGTQTGGSVLRPAAFNGIVGFKPTYMSIRMSGIIPAAWQFDTLGVLTRSVEDAQALWHLLRWQRTVDWQNTRDKMPPAMVPKAPQRLWRVREYFETEAEREATAAVDEICALMARRGVEIVEGPLPESFKGIHDAHFVILSAEAALFNAQAYRLYPEKFPPKLAKLVEDGLAQPAVSYVAARRQRLLLQEEMGNLLAGVDGAMMPPALGPAPADLSQTGSAAFNAPWSLCGVPAISLPVRLASNGLPLGVQWIGQEDQEDKLLSHAAWLESLINFNRAPG
jgi:aspartyl-tRNA(Asn)/glutamyl-tRNA(Gln) amidotransferase subunit A